jgi:hypothetical protein
LYTQPYNYIVEFHPPTRISYTSPHIHMIIYIFPSEKLSQREQTRRASGVVGADSWSPCWTTNDEACSLLAHPRIIGRLRGFADIKTWMRACEVWWQMAFAGLEYDAHGS